MTGILYFVLIFTVADALEVAATAAEIKCKLIDVYWLQYIQKTLFTHLSLYCIIFFRFFSQLTDSTTALTATIAADASEATLVTDKSAVKAAKAGKWCIFFSV